MCKKFNITILALVFCLSLFHNTHALADSDKSIAPPLAQLIKKNKDKSADFNDAVILYKKELIEVVNQESINRTTYIAISINSELAAKDYAQISLSFNSYYDDIKLNFARLIDENGKVHEVSKNATQINSNREYASYTDTKYLTFSLPRLKKGVNIEYQFTASTKRPVMDNQWFDRASFHSMHSTIGSGRYRIDPVLESIIELSAKDPSKLKINFSNSDIQPERFTKKNGNTLLRWSASNLPELKIESAMVPFTEVLPLLSISSIQSWQDIDMWAKDKYLIDWNKSWNKQLTKLDIEKGASQQKIVESVFYFMQDNIRYISADLNRGGVIPRTPSETLELEYGDCKDQAVFISSLLRDLGIKAYPALINPYNSSNNTDRSIPSLRFNHAIVYVETDSESFFLDTSGETGNFPGLDYTYDGALSLVLNGNGGKLVELPVKSNGENTISVDTTYLFKDSDVIVNYEIVINGGLGNRFKNAIKVQQEQQTFLKQIAAELFTGATPSDLSAVHINNQRKPLHIKGTVTYKNVFKKDKQKIQISSNLFTYVKTFTGILPLINPEDRVNTYFNELSYTIHYAAKVISPSKLYKGILVNPGISNKHSLFNLKYDHTKEQDDFSLSFSFTMNRGTLDKGEYKNFYEQFDDAVKLSSWDITYVKDNNTYKKINLETLTKNTDSFDELIKLIKLNLTMGEYNSALKKAKQAVTNQPNSSEAHYLYGISLGFTDDYDASEKELKKAEKLGYLP